MKLKELRAKLSVMQEDMTQVVNQNLVDDGNTCEFSQKICVLNALRDLGHTINGIDEEDIK